MSLESMKVERDRFVAFAFASADLLLELDEKGDILFADGATRGLLGIKSDEMIGKSLKDLVITSERPKVDTLLRDAEHYGRFENVRLILQSQTHDALPFGICGYKLPYLKNHYFLTLSAVRDDITAEELATRDYQTGLLKREAFADAASRRIIDANSNGKHVKVSMIDVPGLKEFLDKLPSDMAGNLLLEISDYLRSKSLSGDSAGLVDHQSYSFVHEAATDTKMVMSEIMEMTRKVDPSGKGLSARVETIDTQQASRLTVQDTAHALRYSINNFAKQQGEKFQLETLMDGYEHMLEDTVNRIANFKETVAGSEFEVAFQPIVDLKSGIIHHFEGLVRLGKDKKFDNPFHFISFGEEAGLINEFDLAMTQKTLDVLKEAQRKGYKPLVSVNLSGHSLSSNIFMDTLDGVMSRSEAVRKQVIFEVTESAKIEDMKVANDFLQKMRKCGNLCCLDDFGVAESSFEYLRSLQVDFVKIDGSYVKEAANTERGRHMLKALAGLCRDLSIVTIGEMVEDEKAAALLWECGIKFGQGYLFGKPTVDAETLINCAKPTPFYNGMMRAKRIPKGKRQWWARSE